MKTYTGKERVQATFRREQADRAPVSIPAALQCAEAAGFAMEDFLLDDDKALKIMEYAYRIFPSDVVGVPGDPTLPNIAAARARKKYGEAATQRPKMLAEKAAIHGLEFRHPKESASYAQFLKMCAKTKELFGDAEVVALAPGPWSTAVELRGAEALILDTMDDPPFVHELMRLTTDLAGKRAIACAETGVMVVFGDPSSGCSLISPKMYRDFVKPYHTQLMTHNKQQMGNKTHFGYHICGYTDPIMPDLVETGADWVEIDAPSSLERMLQLSQGKVVIRGNVATDLFSEGTKEQIEESVKRCFDLAKASNAFILSPGCAIPAHAPLEKIRYYMEAAFKFGTY